MCQSLYLDKFLSTLSRAIIDNFELLRLDTESGALNDLEWLNNVRM